MFDLYHKTNKHENPNQNQRRPSEIIERRECAQNQCLTTIATKQ
jgi:hypothetical protein